jgi:hypothetical protein
LKKRAIDVTLGVFPMLPAATLSALPSRVHALRRVAAALGALLTAVLLVGRAGAQPSATPESAPAAPTPALLPPLAPVPKLQLVLPAPDVGSSVRREGPAWPSYAPDVTVPREWRNLPDAELRLEVPIARLDLGGLSLSSQVETVPGRERDCVSDCRGPRWSSALRLKYDAGDWGPLRQTGPQLDLRGARPLGNARARGFLGAGFGGKF